MIKVKKIIQKIADTIVKEYHPEKIILFGSYAYGKPNEDADIDFLIVKETKKSFYQRLQEVRDVVSKARKGYAFEPIVLTPKELEKRLKIGDQFFKEILAKGKVLYGK